MLLEIEHGGVALGFEFTHLSKFLRLKLCLELFLELCLQLCFEGGFFDLLAGMDALQSLLFYGVFVDGLFLEELLLFAWFAACLFVNGLFMKELLLFD